MAGLARERVREQKRLQIALANDLGCPVDDDEKPQALALVKGLHRRATGEVERTRNEAFDVDDGLSVVLRKKRRKRKTLDPYEQIPFFVAEIM